MSAVIDREAYVGHPDLEEVAAALPGPFDEAKHRVPRPPEIHRVVGSGPRHADRC